MATLREEYEALEARCNTPGSLAGAYAYEALAAALALCRRAVEEAELQGCAAFDSGQLFAHAHSLARDYAAEISRLRAEVQRARELLMVEPEGGE